MKGLSDENRTANGHASACSCWQRSDCCPLRHLPLSLTLILLPDLSFPHLASTGPIFSKIMDLARF